MTQCPAAPKSKAIAARSAPPTSEGPTPTAFARDRRHPAGNNAFVGYWKFLVPHSSFPLSVPRPRYSFSFTSPVHVHVHVHVPRPPVAESPSSPQPGVTNPRTEIDVNTHTVSVLHSLILDPREPLFPTLNHEVRCRRTTRRTANLGSQPAALPQATLTSRFQPQGTCQAGATGTASRIARVPKSTSEAQSKSCLGITADRERGRLGNRCRSS